MSVKNTENDIKTSYDIDDIYGGCDSGDVVSVSFFD